MINNESTLIEKLGKLKQFKSNMQILETAISIFETRIKMRRKNSSEATLQLSNLFHQLLKKSPSKLFLVSLFSENKLSRLECEIMLLLMASRIGLLKIVDTLNPIMKYIRIKPADSLRIIKSLSPEGRLCTLGLVTGKIEDTVRITKAVFGGIIACGSSSLVVIKSYSSLLKLLYDLANKLEDRASAILKNSDELSDINSDVDCMFARFKRALQRNPNWPISRVCKTLKHDSERLILVLMIARELEYLSDDNSLFLGSGLAAAVSYYKPSIRLMMGYLRNSRSLRKLNLIQICSSPENMDILTENDTILKRSEYELTPTCITELKITSLRQKARSNVRKPLIQFENLVVSPHVKESIQLGLSQIKNSSLLFKKWGLNETIPYGSGVVMLFHGLPGCGKTAAAEAIAQNLDKDILTVNYAEVQNCWVGQTEKNIINTFKMATKSNAVLFWDEADAMFFDRETASRAFEVRDVNVLLQEIERFKGVCILATNRITSLDKALERRISLKIEFERPDRELRKKLWRVLLPSKFPLGKDVDIDKLAEEDLSGGQIKNIILNAARIAVHNGARSKVSQADFEKAMSIEKEGCWSEGKKLLGFGKRCG